MADTVCLPSYTYGTDTYAQLKKFIVPGGRALLIGGRRALYAGREKLLQAAEECRITVIDGNAFEEECTYEAIDQYASQAKENHVQMIFGMGGGKVIDTAKGAAYKAGIPVYTFPTIASTCAASSGLSVVYRRDHSFDSFLYLNSPAAHIFIDPQIIADAPDFYLRAGMGDTIGKYFECWFSSRNNDLVYADLLGRKISDLCYEPILKHGPQALLDCRDHHVTKALDQAILAILINTGLVSLLVKDEYNGAVAHSIYYALCLIKGFEKDHLHGDVVAYGVLVQLMIDHDKTKALEVKHLMEQLGIASTLQQMQIPMTKEVLAPVIHDCVNEPDMSHLPFPVTEGMIEEAMQQVEQLTSE